MGRIKHNSDNGHIRIVLEHEECLHACVVGITRMLNARRQMYVDRFPGKESKGADDEINPDLIGWGKHIEGACAEYAASLALNLSWSGIGLSTFKGADIGSSIQVRLRTRPENGADLCLLPGKDKDEHIYLLVHGIATAFTLMGWCRGMEFAENGDLRNGESGSRLFIPYGKLRRVDDLEALCSSAPTSSR